MYMYIYIYKAASFLPISQLNLMNLAWRSACFYFHSFLISFYVAVVVVPFHYICL